MDDLAENGIRFTSAYCAAPSCSPSRAAILTGQDIFRIEEAGVLTGYIRDTFPVFPLLLQENGYAIGHTGKGYAPRTRNMPDTHDAPIGNRYTKKRLTPPGDGLSRCDYAGNFELFLKEVPKKKPFFFWVGMSEPHLPHTLNLGRNTGIDQAAIDIPGFYPNTPETRTGLSDYLAEIEWADQMLGKIVKILEEEGQLDNTLIVFTSDNGMPFPRAKATLYEYGVHMPLIVQWANHIKGNRVITDPVSLVDLTPTFLELAGVDVPEVMTGKSLNSILFSDESGHVDSSRQFVVTAFEKHVLCRPEMLGFPRRALHSQEWTYIRNYEPDRFPAGHKDTIVPTWGNYGDIDPSIMKTFLMDKAEDPEIKPYFKAGFGKVPAEELFNKKEDPQLLKNLANASAYQGKLEELRAQLEAYLKEHDDPRTKGYSPWDTYNLDRPFPTSQPPYVR